MSIRSTVPLTQWVAEAGGVAVMWLVLFRLNEWLFTGLLFSDNVNWIFLPAALRVLAVLLFGWRGSIGIFLGCLITYIPDMGGTVANGLVLAVVSALAPLVAVGLTSQWLKVPADLKGLSFRQLSIMSLLGAASSALSHTLLFSYQAHDLLLLWGFFPMFTGDLMGTLLLVYSAHFFLRWCFPGSQSSHRP